MAKACQLRATTLRHTPVGNRTFQISLGWPLYQKRSFMFLPPGLQYDILSSKCHSLPKQSLAEPTGWTMELSALCLPIQRLKSAHWQSTSLTGVPHATAVRLQMRGGGSIVALVVGGCWPARCANARTLLRSTRRIFADWPCRLSNGREDDDTASGSAGAAKTLSTWAAPAAANSQQPTASDQNHASSSSPNGSQQEQQQHQHLHLSELVAHLLFHGWQQQQQTKQWRRLQQQQQQHQQTTPASGSVFC